uniref:Uncharacterized protein n=1 Tax=Medicago truncatula TaxID=3880 RepID=I3SM25_MEDTR|nr:unknown [Medicago truncatula]
MIKEENNKSAFPHNLCIFLVEGKRMSTIYERVKGVID